MRFNACDWKGWSPGGLEALARALRGAQAAAQARKDDRRLAKEVELRELAAGVSWPSPKEATK